MTETAFLAGNPLGLLKEVIVYTQSQFCCRYNETSITYFLFVWQISLRNHSLLLRLHQEGVRLAEVVWQLFLKYEQQSSPEFTQQLFCFVQDDVGIGFHEIGQHHVSVFFSA